MKPTAWMMVLERLSEPSTWAGFAALALALGMTGEQWAAWSAGLATFAGLAAMALKERPRDGGADPRKADEARASTRPGGHAEWGE